MRHSIIDMVLATEMTKHFEHLSKFLHVFSQKSSLTSQIIEEPTSSLLLTPTQISQSQSQVESSGGSTTTQQDLNELSTPENIILIKRMLIKCADVSNPARNIKLCEIWANRISEEYCNQVIIIILIIIILIIIILVIII